MVVGRDEREPAAVYRPSGYGDGEDEEGAAAEEEGELATEARGLGECRGRRRGGRGWGGGRGGRGGGGGGSEGGAVGPG